MNADKRYILEQRIKEEINKKKGLVCREFQKVCPTDNSFKLMIKEMHNIFDALEKEILELIIDNQENEE